MYSDIKSNLVCFSWSEDVEAALSSNNINDSLKGVLGRTEEMLKLLADLVLQDQPTLRRKKLEHLVQLKFTFLFHSKIIF